ncbi:hypothetical protein BVRB_032600 [Beta vulgaris subsp. vulgaris]|uniref:Uncharacterized protein n=1 Tax=Beta vulgaris subsp. vulgaris TaxID=3555 RepID=A0A0J8B0A6_BETVV|nr:hypothetical protein BVRB_032600 [Beta vulgaris subsp. vulgaris]
MLSMFSHEDMQSLTSLQSILSDGSVVFKKVPYCQFDTACTPLFDVVRQCLPEYIADDPVYKMVQRKTCCPQGWRYYARSLRDFCPSNRFHSGSETGWVSRRVCEYRSRNRAQLSPF